MAFFSPGQEVPEQEFRPRELVAEESWGEIWRADFLAGQRILLVAYTTPEGDAMFAEARPALERWRELAGSTCPHLLRIHKISDTAIPFLLVEDPGDKNIREFVMSQPKMLEPIEQARFAKHAGLGVYEAVTYDVGPVGVTPDTIFRNPLDRENAWKLLPVAPTSTAMYRLLGGGRYFPPEVHFDQTTGARVNSDSFSVAWIWAELLRRDFTSPRADIKSAVPQKMLGILLENCLAPKGGTYGDARVLALGAERWLKHDADADFLPVKGGKKKAKKSGGGISPKTVGQIKGYAIIAIILALIGGGAFAAWSYRDKLNPLKVTSTTNTPMGLASLYYEAMIARDVEKIKLYTDEAGANQTFQMLKKISDLERGGWIDKFNSALPRVSGSGNTRTSECFLKSQSDDIIGVAQMTLKQQPDGTWKVIQVFFNQMVFPVPGVDPPYAKRTAPASGRQ